MGCGDLSGLPIRFSKNWYDYNKYHDQTASLDRIDSMVGYLKGNCHWTHKHLNHMKWDYNQEYFIKTCKEIIDFQTKPKILTNNYILEEKILQKYTKSS